MRIRTAACAGLAGLLACGDDSDATGAETETGGETSASGSESATTELSTSSTDTGEVDTSSSSSESSGGTETDDMPPPDGQNAMLLRLHNGVGGISVYRLLVDDEGVEGPTLTHASDISGWTARALPGQRAIFAGGVEGPNWLWLASLDDPLPGDLQALDVPPVPPGFAGLSASIPEADALLLTRDEALFRVDLHGLAPTPPVLVASRPTLVGREIDPAGRHVLVYSTAPTGEYQIERALLDPPAPDALEHLVELPPGGQTFAYATPHTATGDGAFVVTLEDGAQTLQYVQLDGDGIPAPTTIVGPVMLPEGIFDPTYYYGTRQHPDAPGVVFGIGESEQAVLAQYVGIEDGVALPAVPLHSPPAEGSHFLAAWGPDGRWLAYIEYAPDSSAEFGVVHLGDGHTPTTTPIRTLEPNESWYWLTAPDAIYIEHQLLGTSMHELLRLPLVDDTPGDLEVVSPPRDYQTLHALGPGYDLLLFGRRVGEQELLYGVDVTGGALGEPFVVNVPPAAGYHALDPTISPDGRFIAYIERANLLPNRTMIVVSLDAPGEAVASIEDIVHFDWAREW